MKARCISNEGQSLPLLYLHPEGGVGPGSRFFLTRDREYVVYALTVNQGGLWYYVLDDSGVWYPRWHPAALFSITDPRASKYWVVGLSHQGLEDGSAVVAIAPWARDPFDFYDKLSDGEPTIRQTFEVFRELMDHEFDAPDEKPVVTEVGDGWLCCPICRWLWHQPVRDQSTQCPCCARVLQVAASTVAAFK